MGGTGPEAEARALHGPTKDHEWVCRARQKAEPAQERGSSTPQPLTQSLGSSQERSRLGGAWYAPEGLPTPAPDTPGCMGTPSTSSLAWQLSATLRLGPHGALPQNSSKFPAGRCPGTRRQEGQAKSPTSPGRDHGPRQPRVSNTNPGDRDGNPQAHHSSLLGGVQAGTGSGWNHTQVRA